MIRLMAICLGAVLALCLLSRPRPMAGTQDQDDDVRGAFMTSRQKTTEKPKSTSTAKPNRRRPKTARTKPAEAGNSSSSSANTNTAATNTGNDSRVAGQRIGLGLTLFMRDSNGLAVRVDPAHEFRKGDRVRLLLETNVDGHLYVFNSTNDGKPVMVYPDAQLDEAGNYIRAHVPFEIPSSTAAEERLRWFRFDENAGVERLFFVFTREPLQGVPIEDDLINYCAAKKTECTWHPAAELWAGLQKEMSAAPQVAKAQEFGAAQTRTEHDATTRGIGLAKDDPEPSLVIMTASSGPAMLVTALDLVHK